MSFERTRRLLSRLLGARPQPSEVPPGVEATLDGRAAIAVTEALISEAAGLAGPAPEDPSARALFEALTHPPEGSARAQLSASRLDPGDGATGALATAVGMAASGLRTAAFVEGRDLPALADLLTQAAAHQIPLVVHAACTAGGGPTRALGDGHHGYHAIADTGLVTLFAKDVQEAVDLTLVARRVAEQALVPVLVAMDAEATGASEQAVLLPEEETVRAFVGRASDVVDAATVAQRHLFGRQRRRLVRWHDLDHPLLLGATQGPESWAVTQASRHRFLTQDLPRILQEAFEAFGAQLGRARGSVRALRDDKAEILVVAQGSLLSVAEAAAKAVDEGRRHDIGVLGLTTLRPWPGPALARALAKARAVVVLERTDRPLGAEPPLTAELRQVFDRALENGLAGGDVDPTYPTWSPSQRPRLYSARAGLGGPLAPEDLAGYLQAVLRVEAPRAAHLGLVAKPDLDAWPKREVLADAVRDVPSPVAPFTVAPPAPEDRSGRPPPPAVRHLSVVDNTVSGLARFWDQVGALYSGGAQSKLTPDPFLATGAVPVLTAAAPTRLEGRQTLPAFDATKCTGCGVCWTTCPDGAIGVVAKTPEALLEAGLGRAKAKGGAVDVLRPLLGRIGKAAARSAMATDAPGTAGALFSGAFEEVLAKAKGDAARKQAFADAFALTMTAIEEVSVSATDTMMRGPEAKKPGDGTLLSLAVDPDTCKGCGLCVAACADDALAAEPDTPERTAAARAGFETWAGLGDTAGPVIDRLSDEAALGPLAASLLTRFSAGLVGADDVEPGSGERQALRLVLAEAEAARQRAHTHTLERNQKLREALSKRLRGLLDEALPVQDLQALSSSLESLGKEDVDLAALTAKMRGAGESSLVDAHRLQEVTEVARRLEATASALREGSQGLGRGRISLVLAPGTFAEGLARFPHNPFTGPVIVARAGATARLARGLFEGQLAAAQAELADLDTAQRLVDGERGAAPTAEYEALTPAQRLEVPPVFVVGDEATLGEAELGGIIALLATGRPFKVVVLADPGRRLGPLGGAMAPNLGLFAALERRAYVAQSSVAYPKHFGRALAAAIAYDGPALLHLYAPSPRRDGTQPDASLELARLAVTTRVFPLFTYDPRREGVFGSRMDLSENPAVDAEWVQGPRGAMTPVQWMRAQGRFAQFLESSELPPRFSAAVDRWGAEWRALQELAGEVTPFTARVEAEAEARLVAEHAAQIAALEAKHAAALASLRAELEAGTAARVTDRLLELAGYGKGSGSETGQS